MRHLLTARDNKTYSLTKLVAVVAAMAMVRNFVVTDSVDFNGFGLGIGAMIASMAAKYYVEDKEAK
jgi:hypothetical protein